MKLCAAQLHPVTGDIEANLSKHLKFIQRAAAQQAEVVFFPELSLTGFEPRLASSLAIGWADHRLDVLQECSAQHNMLIGVGMPIVVDMGVQIGMVWFSPGTPRRLYAKQQLHIDETSYFVPGNKQLVIEHDDYKLAPAICYESLQMSHADEVAAMSADIYLASVAKPAGGLAKAMVHYPEVAKRHSMSVIMANCVGPCDDFISVGQSAAWNAHGELLAQLHSEAEGILVLDTVSETAIGI
ncbi:carbon-nitrogen hydrolase family protein [Vreelandella populi]|uniref:Carbon-nitrogen hydrolase family protein n=1 Tax=Vreelandella populi TaxID=2498858 RepID=A0A433LH46_9GAMM|nr:carbon-nitrogen hydrolase family protein [Halomonas populi]RUR40837.1 carbon-nitrogen hydrolase family protein [Halomonas populi]RUR49344.1 carbon-nitrogen hydrolase family protein [Halomonas populi]